MSSKLDRETGEVEITAACYATMPVGYRLAVIGSPAEWGIRSASDARFDDYLARLVLSRQNGHAWGEGVHVVPPDEELARHVELGLLHESLVEEPKAA